MTSPYSLPSAFVERMIQQLGVAQFGRFEAALLQPAPVSVRINPSKKSTIATGLENIPWCPHGFYLPERPYFTYDPALHGGAYYVQEASSMSIWQVLSQLELPDEPLVLDLCAAPGGKSTLLSSFLSGKGLLVANEPIRQRAQVLLENLTKWGDENVAITQSDPALFDRLDGLFDLVLTDAPCSGEGLFRKDPDSMKEWSPSQVHVCSERQHRILKHACRALKPGGYLIYSTCTYAPEEDDNQVLQTITNFDMEPVKINFNDSWGIEATDYGHLFYPHQVRGEGFYIACLRKKEGETKNRKFSSKLIPAQKQDVALANAWLSEAHKMSFYLFKEQLYAFPSRWKDSLDALFSCMPVISFGVEVGRNLGKELVPAHALAVSRIVNQTLQSKELDLDQAIRFLKKDEIKAGDAPEGWTKITHAGNALGWAKVLKNRVNNYYPKEWRILK